MLSCFFSETVWEGLFSGGALPGGRQNHFADHAPELVLWKTSLACSFRAGDTFPSFMLLTSSGSAGRSTWRIAPDLAAHRG